MTKAVIKSTNKEIKIDGRTKNGIKLDPRTVIRLRDVHKLSFGQIANQLNYTRPYIHSVYKNFKKLLPSDDILNTYKNVRTDILSGMELDILQKMSNKDVHKKATLGNYGYVLDKISNLRRLEEGKTGTGSAVTIEIVFQDAQEQAKKLQMKHAGSSTTADESLNNDADI